MSISKLQITRQKFTSEIGKMTNILELFQIQPTMMTSLMVKLRGGMNDPIGYLTDGLGKITKVADPGEAIRTLNWRWALQGDEDKPIRIISNNQPSNATPGRFNQIFSITVEENRFAEGDVIAFDNPDYTARVHSDPTQDGNGNWILQLKLNGSDQLAFVPAELLDSHRHVTKYYTLVPAEGSETGGKTFISTGFMMENVMSTLRKEYSITRMANKLVAVYDITWTNPDTGKTSSTKMFATAAQLKALDEFMVEKEKSCWFSEYSGNAQGQHLNKDKAGNILYQTAGIRQQISDANRRYYTNFSEDLIREFMIDLAYNAMDKNSRKFICFTGEMGFDIFDRAMKDSLRAWQPIESGLFTSGTQNALGYGNQFVTYRGLNGTEVTLKHLPIYDDLVRGGRYVHKETRKPIESYRMTFLDLGYNQSNIKKIYLEGEEFRQWEVAGSFSLANPSAGSGKSMAQGASAKDQTTVHMMTTQGIQITNPLGCGELICDNAELVS